MMKFKTIISAVCLILVAALSSSAMPKGDDTVVLGGDMPSRKGKERRLTNTLIAPKGEWQCGLSVMYANLSGDDSEYMLLLQGINAGATMLRLAPEALYTFRNNHAIGIRACYTDINGMIDTATADLLGNLSLTVEDINASSYSFSASIFQRTYVGLDDNGRIGIFWDYELGVAQSKSQFYMGEPSSSYSLKKSINLDFSPGIVYFPMNNVSVQACISLAGLSYNNVTSYSDGQVTGVRDAWKAQASINILNMNMGVTVHF